MNNELWNKCVEFHGHECPGLAIGFRASQVAIKEMGLKFSSDEELVCITESKTCAVDGVQVITGCTFGKSNLIYKETGEMAFSFFDRKSNNCIRIVLNKFEGKMSRKEKEHYILNAPVDEIFSIKKPNYEEYKDY